MLSYHIPISIKPVQTMIKVKEIVIQHDDFILMTTRRKFFGKSLNSIKKVDAIWLSLSIFLPHPDFQFPTYVFSQSANSPSPGLFL